MAYGEAKVELHSFSRWALDRSNPTHAIKACEEMEAYLHSFLIGDPMHVIKTCAGGKGVTPSSLTLALYRRDTTHTMKE